MPCVSVCVRGGAARAARRAHATPASGELGQVCVFGSENHINIKNEPVLNTNAIMALERG
eukprot:2518438-Prymnesium_polylepis.1